MKIITEHLTKTFNARRNQPPIVAVEDLNLEIQPVRYSACWVRTARARPPRCAC